MQSIRFSWFLFMFAILPCVPFAQDNEGKGLSRDPEEFAKHIEDKFSKLQSENAEQVLATFLEDWESGQYNKAEQDTIMKLEVLMNAERYRPSSGYLHYLEALNISRQNDIDAPTFQKWHKALHKLVEQDRNNFNKFNQTLNGFFNQKAIYTSRTKNWYVNTSNLELEFEDKPYLVFDNVNLTCVGQGDTISIKNTSGKMDILDGTWTGQAGKITWEKVNLAPDKVYAELKSYEIPLKRGEFETDSVAFYNANIMNKPLHGKLHEKLSNPANRASQFPKFTSYQASYEITGLFDNINYEGGFTMEGRQITGTGSQDKRASIEIVKNNKRKLVAKSQRFTIDPEGIDAKRTNSAIYFQGDSLYHNNISFKYRDSTRLLTLSKEEGLGESPLNSSFHNLEINVDHIEWNINESSLSMKMARNSPDPAKFQSINYFDYGHYRKVQSILNYNPLNKLQQYSERIESKSFTDKEYANFLGSPLNNAKRMLIRLGKEGFILYNTESGKVRLQPKLFHYVKAEKDLKDYDRITFNSVISRKPNAKLDLNSGDLKIEGMGTASLSDTSAVKIVPENQQITIKEDLHTEFDGQMVAGRFHYFGDDFYFNYDSFKVALNSIDSLRIYFPEEKTKRMKAVDHVIEDISGSVYINHPNNKSGKVPMNEYPIFDCTDEAVVHYEKPHIQGGVYSKDSFYFEIEPFEVDSLKNFTRKGIHFDGTFHSADIFPEFEHHLTLMKDNSLGFTKRTPPEGLPMYTGKGTGFMEITLNKQGLRGAGKVDYLASTTESRNFLLFPDSMNATTQGFTIASADQNKYPPVNGEATYNHWKPYNDSMYIQEKEPITVYDKALQFKGNLVLTPEQLYGTGTVNYSNSEIQSKSLAFQPEQVSSDTASFKLRSSKNDEVAFSASNVNFNLDLNDKKLEGKANFRDTLLPEFDQNRYHTSIREFDWDVEEKTLAMNRPQDQHKAEAFMQSLDRDQDSLKYNASSAFLSLTENTIETKQIPYIPVADARIFPKDSTALIKENGKLKTLEDAKIKADTAEFYHELYNAQVNVVSQSEYFANADYDYVDRNEEEHQIHFGEVRINGYGETVGKANLPDTQEFPISPKFRFQGNVNLKGSREALFFKGTIKVADSTKEQLATTPIDYADTVYPDSLYIPYGDSVLQGGRLTSGVFLSPRYRELYPRFLGPKKGEDDIVLFKAKGHLFYDYEKAHYAIAPQNRNTSDSNRTHRFIYDESKETVTTKGPVQFQIENEVAQIKSAGIVNYDLKDSTHKFDLVMGVDFPFDEDALKKAADSIANLSFYKPDVKNQREAVKIGMSHLIDDVDERQKVLNELNSYGTLIANEAYRPNFLFTDLQLTWDEGRRAFVNDGKAGLGTIMGTEINKKLDGYMELSSGMRSKEFQFMVKGDVGNYYYFNIGEKYCDVISSDAYFMERIRDKQDKYSDNDFELRPLSNETRKMRFEKSFERSDNNKD